MSRHLALVTLPLLAAACGDNTLMSGTITSTVYGEELIEEGIPADVFEDGWAVRFDNHVVSIGEVEARAGEAAVGDAGMYLVDLARPSGGAGYELATYDAPAGTYDHYGYRIRPASDAVAVNVDPADAAAMQQAGASIWVRGTATRAGEVKTFDWQFTLSMAFAGCEVAEEITDGAATIQATIHADHFFYDDAISEEPNVAFQLLADADLDGDGAVTRAELVATDIRSQARYQVGSSRDPKGDAITNLWQYLELQATTLGHINGEGHCDDVVVEP